MRNYSVAKKMFEDLFEKVGIDEDDFEDEIYPMYEQFETLSLEECVQLFAGDKDTKACWWRLRRMMKAIQASFNAERASRTAYDDIDVSVPDEVVQAFRVVRDRIDKRAEFNIKCWRNREPLPGREEANY